MSIPTSVYPAPFNCTRASHVVWSVKDLARSKAFYVDAFGFAVSDEDANTLWLRGIEEACHHSLVLKKATDAPRAERVGLRVYTEEDLDRAMHVFSSAGLPAAFVEVPHQGRTLHVTDPVGTPLELCATQPTRPRLVVQFREHHGACPGRIDHFQILTPDVRKACEFYCSLGFRLSEFIAVDDSDELLFVFLQRKGNPHDIVFASQAGPRLHHAAFAVPDAAHLLQACDIAGAHGFGGNLEAGPGRHGPGHALYCYFRDPDGHRIELFTTHYQVMDIENEPVRWNLSQLKQRPWGFPPRRKWYEEATPFRDVAVVEPAQKGNPMTLERWLMEDA
jgi:catechol 2,3-dioxygenase